MNKALSKYFAALGRKGGRKSRRHLDPEAARAMVRVREARRAYNQFHTTCFWSYDPAYLPTKDDVSWVADMLMKHGGREAWAVAAKLCH